MNFNNKVYDLCRKIPKGKVTTYKILAEKLNTKAYRAVGQALMNNPFSPEVPCHRVIASSGDVYGFKGKLNGKAIKEKIFILTSEGIEIKDKKIDIRKFLFRF